MIINMEVLEYIYTLVKNAKKDIVKIYPNGNVVGTDEQFASLNILYSDEIVDMIRKYNITIPYVFFTKEISAFMRNINEDAIVTFSPYEMSIQYTRLENVSIRQLQEVMASMNNLDLPNHIELSYQIDELVNRVISTNYNTELYRKENIQQELPELFSMRASDGGDMFCIDNRFYMTSFNSIHPANKSDRVDLIIRDCDVYSYIGLFVIYKKKGNYQLHEYLRFRKI